MDIKFYCKELGKISFCSWATYKQYKNAYPDLVPYGYGLFDTPFSLLCPEFS